MDKKFDGRAREARKENAVERVAGRLDGARAASV